MKHKKGQILLITVMLMATVISVVMTMIFQSTTDTQVTKLQEESQKALAAAEAGIEKVMSDKITTQTNFRSLNFTSTSFTGIDLEKSTAGCSDSPPSFFISEPLQRDEQYTFYLMDYDTATHSLSGNYAAGDGDLILYFGQAGNCPTLEITIIDTTGTVLKRRFANPPCSSIQGSGLTVSAGGTLSDETFGYQATVPNADLINNSLMFIRVLSPSNLITRIGIKPVIAGTPLPIQGTTCSAVGQTTMDVRQSVRFFQSYPQVPSELFVTRF